MALPLATAQFRVKGLANTNAGLQPTGRPTTLLPNLLKDPQEHDDFILPYQQLGGRITQHDGEDRQRGGAANKQLEEAKLRGGYHKGRLFSQEEHERALKETEERVRAQEQEVRKPFGIVPC